MASPAPSLISGLSIDDVPGYGIHDVYTDMAGRLYFWLPQSTGDQDVEAALAGYRCGAIHTRDGNDLNARTLLPRGPAPGLTPTPLPTLGRGNGRWRC